jgi:hypothetical protein
MGAKLYLRQYADTRSVTYDETSPNVTTLAPCLAARHVTAASPTSFNQHILL